MQVPDGNAVHLAMTDGRYQVLMTLHGLRLRPWESTAIPHGLTTKSVTMRTGYGIPKVDNMVSKTIKGLITRIDKPADATFPIINLLTATQLRCATHRTT